jgi:hypothetical protein
MVRVVIVAAVLALVVQAEARPGKVVRVERRSSANIGIPRVCQVQPPAMTTGWCFGSKPDVGDSVTIVAPNQAAKLKLRTVAAYNMGCNQATTSIWTIEGEIDEGDAKALAKNPYGGYQTILDGGLDAHRSRMIPLSASVSGRQTDQEYYGIDRDGDGKPDLAFDHYLCDAQGQPSQTTNTSCYEVWTDTGHGWKRLRVDVVLGC